MFQGETLSLRNGTHVEAGDSRPMLAPCQLPWQSRQRADDWFRREALTPPPADLGEPFTLSWFLALEYHRHLRHGRWLPHALEFSQHHGETVVALGYGLGTDWVQYARYGARVIVGCPDHEELAVARHHFSLRGLGGIFLHAPQPPLSLPEAVADLVYLSHICANLDSAPIWLGEAHRLLKPGGKLLMVERVPGANYRAGRNLTRHLKPWLSAFQEISIRRYHLQRAQLAWYWRWLPRRWLERLFGQFLLVKAYKPIMLVPSVRRAA
ncbi:MAG: methyltransferase domain-containing protein [Gemmatales bacterium]|nr:class I SAM-dependent methyltransferase [Gemmatales bacterium]MDW7993673.1 methyltransferase domain-containing protein [Gemmatales bacterium]